ncbi:MAG: cbb3-type cytochrome c oxidase N-terminal domain-containing protein [Saprospiraceae bacterium]
MTSKKHLSTLLLMLTSLTICCGQTVQATATDKTNGFFDIMTTAFLIMATALFVVVIAVVVRTNAMLAKHLIRLELEKQGISLPNEIVQIEPQGDDFWTRMRKRYWENPVAREQEGDIMLGHNYDGIRELDNHLPPWWVNMFVLSCLWAVGYMWYYHWGGNGPNQAEEYKTEMESAKKKIATALAGKANAVDESNVAALTDSGALGEGELIFKSVCAACHGQKGEGTVGPNFTDEQWIHGGGIKNLFKTIKYGVPDKGMIAWSSQLKPVDIQKVASYILTLKGTNPPNPKAPQGEIWKDDSATVTQDSTKADKG